MDVPAHVPKNLVFDFDFFHPGPKNDLDPFLSLKALSKRPRTFWSPRHGGHWVFTRGADFPRVLNDTETFSSRLALFRSPDQPLGIRFIPLEIDPPHHSTYRKPLDHLFEQDAMGSWIRKARKLAIGLIEEIREKGQCEFMAGFGSKFPATFLMSMYDLPVQDASRLAKWCLDGMRPPEDWGEAPMQLASYMRRLMFNILPRPSHDHLSKILAMDMGGGRRMNDDEALGMIAQLIGGGLNKTAASMGWTALFLARNPAHRAQLVSHPSLMPNAVFELLRRFSAPQLWRVLRRDAKFEGVELRAGDKVFLPTALHGLDETLFERPMEVDFGRGNARQHVAFCVGPHQCPARELAVQLIVIFLEEWLKRIPDFEIPPGAQPRVEPLSWIMVTDLPLRWERRSSPRRKRAG